MQIIKAFQDFKLTDTQVSLALDFYGKKYKFTEKSIAYMFFILEEIFDLQDDEIYNSLTDTSFITRQSDYIDKKHYPHDRGIDAIIIDEENKIVHLFNFKHISNYEKAKNAKFESNEIDKVLNFLTAVFERKPDANSNPKILEKLNEIFSAQEKGVMFSFQIYFSANIYEGFTTDEENRLAERLKMFRGTGFQYILLDSIVQKLTSYSEQLDARFKIVDNHFFEKSEFGRRALIVEIYAKDLIRIVSNDKELRNNLEADDILINQSYINENAFEDNVRVYKEQGTNVNKNIKSTALDEQESKKFFFYNNGITITCEEFDYRGHRAMPIILKGLQIVNGSQTIHSLKDAMTENKDFFDDISLLCRIYETKDQSFKNKIAEYTNNQNPVTNRDIRSIDVVQIKLEKELVASGYYYERKKNQHKDKNKEERIDAEKLGQAMLSYYVQMPGEAKNKKSIIFSTKYNEIFDNNITAEKALKAYRLYIEIENKKIDLLESKPFLSHATYYIMYFISLIASNDELMNFYDKAIEYIEFIRGKEKEKLKEKFSDAVLFKGSTPKAYLSELGL
ncbi:MAG: AIPR family protein [Sulfurimonas sp.]|uniref:AIPR family protein n=1 Tax=Sulfurimonas sp. TaxID=2022749 RepID=UPI0026027A9B|nr:AIPR family protein [Sulfurimonas sp.]MDD3475480.1 AIPR family protein [Sulfurimonas sp.]